MLEKAEFIKSVYNIKDIPKDNLPEVVLCGRSNVGKSSFINSILNRKGLAKTSSTPGKTRSINYYKIDDRFYFTDLPGFGYAKISKREREKWAALIGTFLEKSPNIVLAFHLIDSRHKPTELDIQFNELLKYVGIPYIVILTKSDKLKQAELARSKRETVNIFPELSYGDNLLYYSTVKNTGKKEVIKRLQFLY